MPQEPPANAEVEGLLEVLGVESLCQWDVMVFLYRHQTTLVGADYLARLLGYATEPVIEALDALESLELVARSRVSQGARLYQFTVPPGPPRGAAFDRLLELVSHRSGRTLVSQCLRRGDRAPGEGLAAPHRLSPEDQDGCGMISPPVQPRKPENVPWLKVI
jgi:hypothetical protein